MSKDFNNVDPNSSDLEKQLEICGIAKLLLKENQVKRQDELASQLFSALKEFHGPWSKYEKLNDRYTYNFRNLKRKDKIALAKKVASAIKEDGIESIHLSRIPAPETIDQSSLADDSNSLINTENSIPSDSDNLTDYKELNRNIDQWHEEEQKKWIEGGKQQHFTAGRNEYLSTSQGNKLKESATQSKHVVNNKEQIQAAKEPGYKNPKGLGTSNNQKEYQLNEDEWHQEEQKKWDEGGKQKYFTREPFRYPMPSEVDKSNENKTSNETPVDRVVEDKLCQKTEVNQLIISLRMRDEMSSLEGRVDKEWSNIGPVNISPALISDAQKGRATRSQIWKIGSALFSYLLKIEGFKEKYQLGFERAIKEAPLRIIIELNENCNTPGIMDSASLPWETLYDTERKIFLALDGQTRLTRRDSRFISHTNFEKFYRTPVIGFSSASPAKFSNGQIIQTLSCQSELHNLQNIEQTAASRLLKVKYNSPLTKDNLSDALGHVRLFHFTGHGEQGKLLLEDKERNAVPLTSDELNVHLSEAGLIAATINCCNSSSVSSKSMSIAQTFLERGTPFVVAMTGDLLNEAGIIFGREYYTRLVAGFDFETALQLARRRLYCEDDLGESNWFLPAGWSQTDSEIRFIEEHLELSEQLKTEILHLDDYLNSHLQKAVVMQSLSPIQNVQSLEESQYQHFVHQVQVKIGLQLDNSDLSASTSKKKTLKENEWKSKTDQIISTPNDLSEIWRTVPPAGSGPLIKLASNIQELTSSVIPQLMQSVLQTQQHILQKETEILDKKDKKKAPTHTPIIEHVDYDPPLPAPSEKEFKKICRIARGNLTLDNEIVNQCILALIQGRHIVLTGPPGTGKSTFAENLATAFNYKTHVATANPDWTTFDVIGGPFPYTEVDEEGRSNISYLIRSGCVVTAIKENWEITKGLNPKRYRSIRENDPKLKRGTWLIIDEMNRAPIDQAFGDLFTGLASNKIRVPRIMHHKGDSPTESLPLPKDFRIICTANTRDKHLLFEFSEALKRRFAFIEIPAFNNNKPEIDDIEKQKLVSQLLKRSAIIETLNTSSFAADQRELCLAYFDLISPIVNRIRLIYPLGTAQVLELLGSCVIRHVYATDKNKMELAKKCTRDHLTTALIDLDDNHKKLIGHLLLGTLADFLLSELEMARAAGDLYPSSLDSLNRPLLDFLRGSDDSPWDPVINSIEELRANPDDDNYIDTLSKLGNLDEYSITAINSSVLLAEQLLG